MFIAEASIRIPADQRFYLQDEGQVEAEALRLGVALPLDATAEVLRMPLRPAGLAGIFNRFCARPEAGNDADPDGAPSALTRRRYERLAAGGYGLVCTEPVAVSPAVRHDVRQLCLHAGTQAAFAALLAGCRGRAGAVAVTPTAFLLQLADCYPGPVDLPAIAAAAAVAVAAGFDGIEIWCHEQRLDAEIGSAGGDCGVIPLSVCDAVSAIRSACPDVLIAVRLCVYTARGGAGFGTDADDFRRADPAQPIRLAQRLSRLGVSLLSVTMNYPARRAPEGTGARQAIPPDGFPHEHPLGALARGMQVARAVREAVPELTLIAGGLVWLRQFMPPVAAGLIREGFTDMVALDRFSLAYPDAPADWFREHRLDPYRCCTQCGACSRLRDAGAPVGCVLQDRERYGGGYRAVRRFEAARLLSEARRCHQCAAAPCVRATPGRLDIPAFMRAYARGDLSRAGRLLRRRQILPEMCALLAPFGASGERDCIETVLSGQPVAIRDLQYSAAFATRAEMAGAVPPPVPSGFRIAIAGAGPTGLAAAGVLIGYGHSVSLYERADAAGGVPALLIPPSRYSGAREEIDALLAPARQADRLKEHYRTVVGTDISIADLRRGADALLLSVGLWQDRYLLGAADGVYGGLAFLEQTRDGATFAALHARTGVGGPHPKRAVVLAGGDCAMDAATVLEAMGIELLHVLYSGGRSDMHWCMGEDWFARPGIHLQTLSHPIAYCRNDADRVTGVQVVRMVPDDAGRRHPVPGSAAVLPADIVVDASGLDAGEAFRAVASERDGIFTAGALVNGGASVPHCVEAGMRAAEKIHRWLNREGADEAATES